MTRNIYVSILALLAISLVAPAQSANAKKSSSENATASTAASTGETVEFFQAVESKQVDAKFIAMNDHEGRLIVTNNTEKPLNLKLPEAFAGVPVAAQFAGGGAGARGGGGGGRSTTTGSGGGGQQSVGGGGGGGLGGGGGGGGGGFFSVPPEKTEKLDLALLCLNHGLRDPSSGIAYKMVPADSVVDRPAVIELLKAFGRGELKHAGAQAAAWHLNNDLSWKELTAKLQGTRRSLRRPPYFAAEEIRAGMSYATAATHLAEINADQYAKLKKEKAEKAAKAESSDARSTTDTEAKEPAKTGAAENKDATDSTTEEKK